MRDDLERKVKVRREKNPTKESETGVKVQGKFFEMRDDLEGKVKVRREQVLRKESESENGVKVKLEMSGSGTSWTEK